MKRKTLNKLLVILLIGLIICGCNKAKRKIEGEKEFSQLVETIKENFKVILDKEKYIVRDSETPQGRIISRPFYEIAEKKPVKYKSKYFIKEEGAKVVITQQGEENFVLEYVPFFSDKESRVFIDIMIKYGFKPYVLNELIYDKAKGNDFSEIERILGKYEDKKIEASVVDRWQCYPNYESASIMFVLDECMIHDYKNGTAKFSYEKILKYGSRLKEYFSKMRKFEEINWYEFMKYNSIHPVIYINIKDISKEELEKVQNEIKKYYNSENLTFLLSR